MHNKISFLRTSHALQGLVCPSPYRRAIVSIKTEEAQLKKIYDAANKKVLRFRFNDSDKFWVQDLTTPLDLILQTTKPHRLLIATKVIANLKEIIFHGRARIFIYPASIGSTTASCCSAELSWLSN